MAKIAVYIIQGQGTASTTCMAMAQGAVECGNEIEVFTDTNYCPEHLEKYDAAIFWGFITTCQNIMSGYRDAGKAAVYLDLAYWERGTHYKVSVNSRHATEYFQKVPHDDSRWPKWGVQMKPYSYVGEHILLAGMGAKAAWAEKEEPVESWERKAIEEIRRFTDRKIIYRPKPSWGGAGPIKGPGVVYSNPTSALAGVLNERAHAVVTHHSNVAVEGLVMGIPCFAWFGLAKPMGLQLLEKIEQPFYPAGREQWLNDVSYCQWSLAEMKDGTCWRHLKSEGLVP